MTGVLNPNLPERKWKYRAFISYSHADEASAKWLHKGLETYRVPRSMIGTEARHGPVPRRLHPIFRDRDELSAAADLSEAIREALSESLYLIVVCSPAAKASRWVNEEILRFKALGSGCRILCYLVEGEPEASFPPALRGEEASEPLAADARPKKDGRELAKLKIIASLLGVRFDDLRRRDERRRITARTIGTCAGALAAAVIALIYIGLADAGAPLPGCAAVQTMLDRRNASVFRPLPAVSAINANLAEARRQLLDRLLEDFQPTRRDHLIAATRTHLINHFESGGIAAGWSSDILTKDAPLDGLTWDVSAALMQAETDGYGALPDGISEAVHLRLIQLRERPFDFPVASARFYRLFQNEHGQEFGEMNGITFLWYPSAVASCGLWLSGAHGATASPEDVTRVRRSLGHLAIELRGSMMADYKGGEPDRASETLYALSSIPPGWDCK